MKMREASIFSRLVALGLTAVFTYTSCAMSSEPTRAAGGQVPVGTPVAFYLDANGRQTTTDTGVTALSVTGNKELAGTLVVSEELEGKGVVRFLVSGTDSTVSMYFDGDHKFPDRLIINQGGELAYGKFSAYDDVNQTYDFELSVGAEKDSINGIVLNKAVFGAYQDDPSLDSSQNIRMERLITALCVWASIDHAANDYMERGWFSSFISGFVKVFVTVVSVAKAVLAVAAVVVTAIFAPAALGFVIQAAALVVYDAVETVVDAWKWNGFDDERDDHASQNLPRIYIKYMNGDLVPNNGDPDDGEWYATPLTTTTGTLTYKVEIVDNNGRILDGHIHLYEAGVNAMQSVKGERTVLSADDKFTVSIWRITDGIVYTLEKRVLILVSFDWSDTVLINDKRAVLDVSLYGDLLLGEGPYFADANTNHGYIYGEPNRIGELSGRALFTVPLELN